MAQLPNNFCAVTYDNVDLLQNYIIIVRFQIQILMMAMAIFSHVAPCILVDSDSHFREAHCLHPDCGGSKFL
jgi:hypothetical protein